MKPGRRPADRQANDNPPDADDEELATGVSQRKRTRRDRSDRETISDQGSGIVHETFAFENRDDSPRDAQALGDGGGCDCVRWRDDCAQDESGGERQADYIVG